MTNIIFSLFFIAASLLVCSFIIGDKKLSLFLGKLVLVIFVFSFLSGCRATKDRKALGRVLADDNLRQTVYLVEAGKYPVDHTPIYLPGETIVITDTLRLPFDVIRYLERECPKANIDSLSRVLKTTVYTSTHTRDTLRVTDPNTYRLYLAAKEVGENLKGQLAQVKSDRDLIKKVSKNKTWALVGAGFVIALLLWFLIKSKFKTKIK